MAEEHMLMQTRMDFQIIARLLSRGEDRLDGRYEDGISSKKCRATLTNTI
jgi:hypothetical protein